MYNVHGSNMVRTGSSGSYHCYKALNLEPNFSEHMAELDQIWTGSGPVLGLNPVHTVCKLDISGNFRQTLDL